MTMKSFRELRKDPHRPSVMDPADYVFVGAADDHPGDSYLEIRHDVLAQHGVETGVSDRYSAVNVPFYDAREDGRPNFRCHHCGKHGSNIRYFCFFLHKPTKQVIVVGQICAKKLSLASREELDFQKRADDFRRMQARHQWVERHQDEYHYLKEYSEQHEAGGWYSEFFESLWDTIQRTGALTDKQLAGLGKWMSRGKPWQREMRDADRHKGAVTHLNDPPTEAQQGFIQDLCAQLQEAVPNFSGMTRIEASDLINRLKAKLPENTEAAAATERQVSFINRLMESKQMPLEQRRKARQQLDAGLTKAQAIAWIDRLKELPDA